MGNVTIQVKNLSKKYEIGSSKRKYDTLRDMITEGLKNAVSRNGESRRERTIIWALKDISFEIEEGEVVGLIGRNGAGKSTLLKILSRITPPTSGHAAIHGRVGSLLEVGTGFHPELTGRENIYLNGAILGMKKADIGRQFDEIVAFAEIEKFIDTPVKRYSSGMYLRLAFAVAAHLDPQILMVDEVLAVGDTQFQKKCLGKMQDVSRGEGRTILFVSHNMDAVRRLCGRSLLISEGRLAAIGDTGSIINQYLNENAFKASATEWVDVSQLGRTGTGEARFIAAQYSSLCKTVGFKPYSNGPLEFQLEIKAGADMVVGSVAVTIFSPAGVKLVNADTMSLGEVINLRKGHNVVRLRIERLHLNPGVYVVGLWIANPINALRSGGEFDQIQSAFELEVIEGQTPSYGKRPYSYGLVTCPFEVLEVCAS
jgi:ABC-type polysaccharide/polyol phosphate transport system ATPase subunit